MKIKGQLSSVDTYDVRYYVLYYPCNRMRWTIDIETVKCARQP